MLWKYRGFVTGSGASGRRTGWGGRPEAGECAGMQGRGPRQQEPAQGRKEEGWEEQEADTVTCWAGRRSGRGVSCVHRAATETLLRELQGPEATAPLAFSLRLIFWLLSSHRAGPESEGGGGEALSRPRGCSSGHLKDRAGRCRKQLHPEVWGHSAPSPCGVHAPAQGHFSSWQGHLLSSSPAPPGLLGLLSSLTYFSQDN